MSKLHKISNEIKLLFVAFRCVDYSVKSCNNRAFKCTADFIISILTYRVFHDFRA